MSPRHRHDTDPDEIPMMEVPHVAKEEKSGSCPYCSATAGKPVAITPDIKGIHTCAQCRQEKIKK